ncbi:hypothetical protein [Streptomyces sp. NPDC088812]|uniref:hypothetical protein n=1 Tax=Streptomyces sp. NPDC088812 TaxID=3365905 RepID=UPI0038253612
MDLTFSEFIKQTTPGPKKPCPTCKTWGLRGYREPDNPDVEKVICTNHGCSDSPFYRGEQRP